MAFFMKEFEHLEIQLEDIISATDNFSESKVIGSGGFGKVYKGELSHSQSEEKSLVAIKRLDRKYGQGDPEFFKEIRMLSCYRHENLISLLGFCKQGGEMILIYEYASRGSLDRYLSSADLIWTQRLGICIDAAKGLSFLHDPNGTQQRVLHCDIKSANILLDDNMTAKVSDFGLSKMGPAEQKYSLLITNAVGTKGYCDPLYLETYSLTKESDVYSFGVVLFEVLCGRLCFEINKGTLKVLVSLWKESYEQNRLHEIMLKNLMQQIDESSLETFASIAYQCLHKSHKERPTMFRVVEKLESALESQKLYDFKLVCGYEEILNVAYPPLKYNSIEELKALLSEGFLINEGNTWFCINDKGHNIERVYIEECLNPDKRDDYSCTLIHPYQVEDGYESDASNNRLLLWEHRYSKRFWNPDYDKDDDDDKDEEKDIYDPRYPGGLYYVYKDKFIAFVRAQYLSPQITYTVTLVFKCDNWNKREFIIIRYKLAREAKVFIVYDTDKRQDGWLMAPLYQFTSQDGTADLEIEFEHCRNYLIVAGIEFHPFEEKVDRHDQVLEEYQDILKAASHYLVYRSIVELKVLLSKGVLLNGYETWLSLNRKGGHCEIVSVASFLIPDEHYTPSYVLHGHSRFPTGLYETNGKGFKTHVRTQFLSPLITYTVNLVFYIEFSSHNKIYVDLKYKLEGETKFSSAHFANMREDGFYVAELYQLTSDGRIVDLDIVFDNHNRSIQIEGIMFEALEKVDHQVPKDGNCLLSDNVHWTKKKHRYPNLLKWLRIHNNGQKWLSADINGKKGLMLSARAACVTDNKSTWESSPESRFGEELVITGCYKFDIVREIRSQLLSPKTAYGTYLVYKLPQDQSLYEDPLRVSNLESRNLDPWYIYLVSPRDTPFIIRGKVDENNHNPLNRPKLNVVPQQRSDGWMEITVCEFQFETTTETISMNLELFHPGHLHELRVQSIEVRPI